MEGEGESNIFLFVSVSFWVFSTETIFAQKFLAILPLGKFFCKASFSFCCDGMFFLKLASFVLIHLTSNFFGVFDIVFFFNEFISKMKVCKYESLLPKFANPFKMSFVWVLRTCTVFDRYKNFWYCFFMEVIPIYSEHNNEFELKLRLTTLLARCYCSKLD